MPSFVVLGNWTDQGIRNVAQAPERIKTTHTMVEKVKGTMQLFYTLGKYDFVMIVDVPGDDAMMEVLLCLGSMGNVRTMTLKAWTELEGATMLTAPHVEVVEGQTILSAPHVEADGSAKKAEPSP